MNGTVRLAIPLLAAAIAITVSDAGVLAAGQSTGDQPAAEQPAGEPLSGRYLNEVIRTSAVHRQTLSGLWRGQRVLPMWVRYMTSKGGYVAGLSREVTVMGVPMELFSACHPRDCDVSHMRVLFTADGKQAWARVNDPATGELFFGDPDPERQAYLRKPGL